MAEKISSVMLSNNIKAFCRFNGLGVPAIYAGYNVSSITDVGTGLYDINYTQQMGTTNYTALAGSPTNSNVNNNVVPGVTQFLVGSSRVQVHFGGSGLLDRDNLTLVAMEVS